ncbi:hypothetical protein [Streptomyces sp. NBC_01014]|uniref:hypothetical protein n=1 Tax=Streptomyces sp. NBC_01014 TaxID=2903719 RepID=UPI00386D8A9C|nr:hypothetical protein OG282_12275 [Streptomyces sp. NBC_01014]
MKLRRTMAAAAATAVMAPVALLAASAAYADGTSGGTPATGTPAAVAPADVGSPADVETPPAVVPTTDPPDSAAPQPTEPAPTTEPPTTAPVVTPPPTTAPPTTAPPVTPPVTTPPADCPVVDDGVTDPTGSLRLSISGLPGSIVAGSGWHPFTISAANPTGRKLGKVEWLALVDNYSESEDEKDWLGPYATVQFFDRTTGTWESLDDEELFGYGVYFGETELGARDVVDIPLRVKIARDAPAGDSFAFGFGGYVDVESGCVHNAYAEREFTVLAAGSTGARPGSGGPGAGTTAGNGNGTGRKVRRTGPTAAPHALSTRVIPVRGDLADTGSPSPLPVLALAGGFAVVLGAGVVFGVHRRGRGATG